MLSRVGYKDHELRFLPRVHFRYASRVSLLAAYRQPNQPPSTFFLYYDVIYQSFSLAFIHLNFLECPWADITTDILIFFLQRTIFDLIYDIIIITNTIFQQTEIGLGGL